MAAASSPAAFDLTQSFGAEASVGSSVESSKGSLGMAVHPSAVAFASSAAFGA